MIIALSIIGYIVIGFIVSVLLRLLPCEKDQEAFRKGFSDASFIMWPVSIIIAAIAFILCLSEKVARGLRK